MTFDRRRLLMAAAAVGSGDDNRVYYYRGSAGSEESRQCTSLTGGWKAGSGTTMLTEENRICARMPRSQYGSTRHIRTINKIDLTDIRMLCCEVEKSSTNDFPCLIRVGVLASTSSTTASAFNSAYTSLISDTEENDSKIFVTIDTTNLTGKHYIALAAVISASTGGGSGQYAYAYAYNIYGLYDENIYFSSYSIKSDEGVRTSNKSITYGGYFPSVCEFGDKLLVAFREATEHLSYNGKIKLLTSSNGGSSFSESTVLSISGRDYRDPELFVYKNKLVLRTFYRIDGTTEGTIQFLTSDDSVTWSEPITITPPLGTFARASGTIVTDANGVLVAGAYAMDDAFHPFLIMTEDLVNFRTKILTDGEGKVFDGNETTCLFLNDGYYAFVRHNTATEKGYLLKFDTSFVFKKKYAVNTVLNGMRALKINDNECFITTRQYTTNPDLPQRTAMFKFNNLSGFYPVALSLGGGVDTSYASIIRIDDTVYVAFYRDKYIFLRTYLYDELSGAFG